MGRAKTYESIVKGWTNTATKMENNSQRSVENTEFVDCANIEHFQENIEDTEFVGCENTKEEPPQSSSFIKKNNENNLDVANNVDPRMMDLQNHENEMMFTMISLSKPDTLTYTDCILQSVEMKIFHTNKVKNTMMEKIKSMCLKETRLMQSQEYFGSFEQSRP